MRAYLLSEQTNVRHGNDRAVAIAKTRLLLLIIVIMFCLFTCLFVFSSVSRAKDPVDKQYISVEVCEGDSLWSICKEHYSPYNNNFDEYIAEVKSLNKLSSDEIHAGAYIVVPYYCNDK